MWRRSCKKICSEDNFTHDFINGTMERISKLCSGWGHSCRYLHCVWCRNVPAFSIVSQETVPAPLCHPTRACQVLACVCVYLLGVWEWKRGLSLSAKRRACEHCKPLSFPVQPIRASACVPSGVCACASVCVGVIVHSNVHVYDRGKERSCQVRLCHWPHKATEGHGSSQLSVHECCKVCFG